MRAGVSKSGLGTTTPPSDEDTKRLGSELHGKKAYMNRQQFWKIYYQKCLFVYN